jgi:hypothetical protein
VKGSETELGNKDLKADWIFNKPNNFKLRDIETVLAWAPIPVIKEGSGAERGFLKDIN